MFLSFGGCQGNYIKNTIQYIRRLHVAWLRWVILFLFYVMVILISTNCIASDSIVVVTWAGIIIGHKNRWIPFHCCWVRVITTSKCISSIRTRNTYCSITKVALYVVFLYVWGAQCQTGSSIWIRANTRCAIWIGITIQIRTLRILMSHHSYNNYIWKIILPFRNACHAAIVY